MSVARIWVDRRDGRKWIVEKRGGLTVRAGALGDPIPQVGPIRIVFSHGKARHSVEVNTDAPVAEYTQEQLRRLFDRARG